MSLAQHSIFFFNSFPCKTPWSSNTRIWRLRITFRLHVAAAEEDLTLFYVMGLQQYMDLKISQNVFDVVFQQLVCIAPSSVSPTLLQHKPPCNKSFPATDIPLHHKFLCNKHSSTTASCELQAPLQHKGSPMTTPATQLRQALHLHHLMSSTNSTNLPSYQQTNSSNTSIISTQLFRLLKHWSNLSTLTGSAQVKHRCHYDA